MVARLEALKRNLNASTAESVESHQVGGLLETRTHTHTHTHTHTYTHTHTKRCSQPCDETILCMWYYRFNNNEHLPPRWLRQEALDTKGFIEVHINEFVQPNETMVLLDTLGKLRDEASCQVLTFTVVRDPLHHAWSDFRFFRKRYEGYNGNFTAFLLDHVGPGEFMPTTFSPSVR